MRFVAPGWLWALLLLPLVYVALRFEHLSRIKTFMRFAGRRMWPAIVPDMAPSARFTKSKLWLLSFAFLLLALARPQWGKHEEVMQVSGLDIMIVLDVSNSMEVEDVVPSRLKKAKHLIRTIAENLRGDRMGLVAFAASSYVACPLTTDLPYVVDTVDVLSPKSVINQGTDIGIALDTAMKSLERGAEEGSKKSEIGSKAIILISDGEDHENAGAEAAAKLKNEGIKLYVFGIGTEKGGPIPVRDDTGQLHGYKKDRTGNSIVSTFRADEMTKVAAAAGGKYWNVTEGEAEVEDLLKEMGTLERTAQQERRYVVYEDRFQFPLAIAVLILFFELSVPLRRMNAAKGLLIIMALAGIVPVSSAQAESDVLGTKTPLNSYIENQKGLKAFNEDKLDEAKKSFGTAQALAPEIPELLFNQGDVQLKAGDTDAAIQSFLSASKAAGEKGEADLQGQSLYNLAQVLTKKGDISGAARAYAKSVESAIKEKDSNLESSARKNLQLLFKEQQKQKEQKQQQQKQQQQQQKQDQKDQQQKDQQKDQQQKEQKDQKDQDKKPEQNQGDKPYADPKQQKQNEFRSLKLSKEDADRVMAELASRERELQGKNKKQGGGRQVQDKDW
jgi:Ca-activated chloride channel family protein